MLALRMGRREREREKELKWGAFDTNPKLSEGYKIKKWYPALITYVHVTFFSKM